MLHQPPGILVVASALAGELADILIVGATLGQAVGKWIAALRATEPVDKPVARIDVRIKRLQVGQGAGILILAGVVRTPPPVEVPVGELV